VKSSLIFIVFCYTVLCSFALASETSISNKSGNALEDTDDIEIGDLAEDVVNEVHRSVSENIIAVSDQIDSFFVAERMESEGSHTQLVFSYYVSEDMNLKLGHDYLFRARLSFPKTQNRLRLVVESTVDSLQEGDEFFGGSTTNETDNDFSAALQLIFAKNEHWQVGSKTGVRFVVPPDPFTQLRIRRLFLYQKWVFRLVETLFVSQSQGFGESTGLEIEHTVFKSFYFRSSSELTVAEKVDDIMFEQNLSLFQPLTKHKMIVYSTGLEVIIESPPLMDRYFINARYRHNFYKKWAFFEIIPEISFDRENNFEFLPIIFLKLDIIFGKT